jgi:hypothetical protein
MRKRRKTSKPRNFHAVNAWSRNSAGPMQNKEKKKSELERYRWLFACEDELTCPTWNADTGCCECECLEEI